MLQATAASYVITPIGDPMRAADRLSARYLIALAARIVREVGALARRDERLPTLALDAEVRVADRAAFADELTAGRDAGHRQPPRPPKASRTGCSSPRIPKEDA